MEQRRSVFAAGVGMLRDSCLEQLGFSPLCMSRGINWEHKKWNCELRCGGVKIKQRLTGAGAAPAGSFSWWGLCCLFSQDLGECKANVTIADVCRCLQMCCWPQQQDRSPASPGHRVGLGSTRKRNWSSASYWIHPQPGSSPVAKAGWGMWGCNRVSPWGTCALAGREVACEPRAAGSGSGECPGAGTPCAAGSSPG